MSDGFLYVANRMFTEGPARRAVTVGHPDASSPRPGAVPHGDSVRHVSTQRKIQAAVAALALLCVAAWLIQSTPTINAPPTGAHAWRETDGLIVARNYCLEAAPFWEPRVNNRGESDGRTGIEFPILNYLSGRLGCASGDFVTPWRVTALLFGCLLVLCLWRVARTLFGPMAAFVAVALFASSPLTPYFSRTAQPDMTAAALATAAIAVAVHGRTWILSALAFALAGAAALVKLPAAVYLMPVVLFSVFTAKPTLRRAAGHLALAASTAIVVLAWYRHAASLQLLSGIANFGLSRSPQQLWDEWQMPKFWLRNFVQFPFDVWIFPLATVVLLGVLVWRAKKTPWRMGVLGATSLAYIFLCGYSGAHHDYYGVILLPLLALMSGWAGAELLSRSARPKVTAVVCVFIAAAAVGWQVARARRFWPTRQLEWAQLSAFSRAEMGSQGTSRIVVFSDGSPQMFWFTGQVGRFGDTLQPALAAGDQFAVVDRLGLRRRASDIESKLAADGCMKVFENDVGWICRHPAAP
jgi:Dolichyl-phosphate-mannose-protein mannosyltransferase